MDTTLKEAPVYWYSPLVELTVWKNIKFGIEIGRHIKKTLVFKFHFLFFELKIYPHRKYSQIFGYRNNY